MTINDESNQNERLNDEIPVESLYQNALLEIKRLENALAYLNGENDSLLQEVKFLNHEVTSFNKKDYENRHIKHKETITEMQRVIINYKTENTQLKDEIFQLKQTIFQLNAQVDELNMKLLKQQCHKN